MGSSRRQFTKEFKLAAVRRLEQGASMGEVARGLEVNPSVPQVEEAVKGEMSLAVKLVVERAQVSRQFLSLRQRAGGAPGSRYGFTRLDPGDRLGMAQLWMAASHD